MNPPRNLSVDAVRLAAAFGVVMIHLAPSTGPAEAFTSQFLFFAVPFFLLISLYFLLNRVSTLQSPRYSDFRLDRILVPYAFWTAAYTVLRLLKLRLEGKPPTLDFVGTIFFGGGAVQLYFLPLLLLFQALVLSAIFLGRASGYRLAGVCVGLGAVAFGYAGSAGDFFGFEQALERGFVYTALAFLLRRAQATESGRRVNVAVGWLTLACIISSAWLGYPLQSLGVILQGPIVGYGMCAFALNWRFHPTAPPVRTLLTCSYGIYLAHVAFLESFELAARKLGHDLTPYPLVTKICVSGLICLGCVVLILLARLHRLPAYLLFGEAAGPAREASATLPTLESSRAS